MPAEWYTKQAKDVAAALNKGKTAAPEAGVACTLVKMPDSLHLLCAGTNSAKAAALLKEAKSNGGKVVSAGTLYNGREGVTFAVSQGSLSIKKQFSDASMTAAGKVLHVVIIAAPGAVLTDAPAAGAGAPAASPAPAAGPTATADDGAAQFKARATRLASAVKQAAASVQAKLQPLLVQALGLGKANRFAEAAPFLDQVEKGLNSTPAAAPPSPASPASLAGADLAGSFGTRAKALTAKLATASAPIQTALKPRLVQALSLAKSNRYLEAVPLLDEVEKGLKAAPAAPAAASPVPPTPSAAPAPPPLSEKVVFTDRLKAIKPRYAAAMQANPPNKPVLEKAMGLAVQSAKAGQFGRAAKVLDGLDKALPRPDIAARLAESRERWLTAREAVGKGISNLQVKLKSHPDPRAQPIAEMGLNGVTGQLQVGLEVALLQCADNPAARPKALQVIAKYRQFLTTDPRVQMCDVNPWNIVVGLRDTLLPALDDLEKVLAG